MNYGKEEEILKTKFGRDLDSNSAALIWNSKKDSVLTYTIYCCVINWQISIKQLRILFFRHFELFTCHICMWTEFKPPFQETEGNEHYSNTCADSLESTLWNWIHTEICQLLCSFLLRAVPIVVQIDIFQYRRLNYCHLLLLALHCSGRAKPLGIHLVQIFLSMKPLHGQILLCHLFQFDLIWNFPPCRFFIFKYLNIMFSIFNKISILKHSHMDKYFPNTFLYCLAPEFKLPFTLKGKSEFWGINYHIFMLFRVIIYL